MEHKLSLDEVTALVRGERIYQELRWPGHKHTAQEYLVYIRDYLVEAMHLVSRNDETLIASDVLGIIRKVAAMCVAFREDSGDSKAYLEHSKVYDPRSYVMYLADLYREAETAILGHLGDRVPALFAIQSMCLQCMQQHGAPTRVMCCVPPGTGSAKALDRLGLLG